MKDVLTYCPDCSERLRYDYTTLTLYCLECEWSVTLSRLTAARISATVARGRDRESSRSRALAVIG